MIQFKNTIVSQVYIHKIGNSPGQVWLSPTPAEIRDENQKRILAKLFLKSFNMNSAFQLESAPETGESSVENFIRSGLNDASYLNDVSRELAIYYSENAPESALKEADFLVVLFENIYQNDSIVYGIGMFIIDEKEDFINISQEDQKNKIDILNGISLKRIEKSCLFLMSEETNSTIAYLKNHGLSQVKNYFTDEYLNLKPVHSSYNDTAHQIDLCRKFLNEEMADSNKLEKMEVMNKSLEYLKENENFNIDSFKNNVFEGSENAEAFDEFRQNYKDENEIELIDEFEISQDAIRKTSRYVRSIIKLDKNFHVYVHGSRQNIERGFDPERNMHFYQLYFNEEA